MNVETREPDTVNECIKRSEENIKTSANTSTYYLRKMNVKPREKVQKRSKKDR